MNWFVYIIKSRDYKGYYVGSTNRLEKRLQEHNGGTVRSTKTHKPFRIVFYKDFLTESDARSYERLLKDKRIEKERIIKDLEDREQSWGVV